MSVYFVYRSHYDNPGAFHVKVFPQDTVLEWFQNIWRGIPMPPDRVPDDAQRHVEELIGRDVHNLELLFTSIHEHGWTPPKSMTTVARQVREAMFANEMRFGQHHMQWLLDDGESDSATYVFDDHFASKNPHRAAFLMREDWQLPGSAAAEGFRPHGTRKVVTLVRGEGATYYACFDTYNLYDLADFKMCGRVEGVRLADFPRYLFAGRNRLIENPHDELVSSDLNPLVAALDKYIKTATGDEAAFLAALTANPDDYAGWCASSDWRMERDLPSLLSQLLADFRPRMGMIGADYQPAVDTVVAQGHVAQACKRIIHAPDTDFYHHFILFDDEWANANRDLAASILRTASRWDPL